MMEADNEKRWREPWPMEIVRGLFSPLPDLSTPVATLGGYDGVHRGHQQVLAETMAWARELGGQSLAVTFDPLPKAVVGPAEALCITSLAHRLVLLERCGIDVTVVLTFDAALSEMPAEEFVRKALIAWLGARHVVVGHDTTFGHRGRGNLQLLRRLEARGLLEVRSPEPVRHRGEVISSTAIRQAVVAGELGEASAMLGRPFSLLGTVVPGRGRGRSLGFPTANLDLHHEAIPPSGVYAAAAHLGRHTYPALTYIGTRPTFEADAEPPAVEVHIIDLQAQLYDRDIEIEFITKLREDTRFPSAAALTAQMNADRRAALAVYSELRPAANRDSPGRPAPHGHRGEPPP